MSFSPGNWVAFVRDADGCREGQRGKVTTTGFLGGLDLEMEDGQIVRNVDPINVQASAPGGTGGGCALLIATCVATAVAAAAAMRGWA